MLCSVCVCCCCVVASRLPICDGLVKCSPKYLGTAAGAYPVWKLSSMTPGQVALDVFEKGLWPLPQLGIAFLFLFSNTLSSVTGTSSPVACKALQRALR